MHKKYLFFVLAFNCVVVAGSKQQRPQIIPDAKMSYRLFGELPEDLVKEVPEEILRKAEKKYIEKEEAKLNQNIEEYYKGVLSDELEIPGSIDQRLTQKVLENNCNCEKEKQQVCTCSRGRGTFYNDNTKTYVKELDACFEGNRDYINNRNILAANKLIERSSIIKEEVDKAAIQYNEKLIILSKIEDALNRCGLDEMCSQLHNGYGKFHFDRSFRDALSAKMFNDALTNCTNKRAATQEELREIWEKSSKLKPLIEKMATQNALIDYLINPDNQLEIEEKKKAAREKEEQERQQKAEEELKRQKNN